MELALTLPLLVTLTLVLVQVAVVATQQVAVVEAARAAAREAAVAPSPTSADARAAALHTASGLDPDRLDVRVTVAADGRSATAEVRYHTQGRIPLAGRLVPSLELTATEKMPKESDKTDND